MAIQINLLLWGCESWALRKDLLEKLERFVNRKIRSILNLNMTNVKEERITNKQLRERFNDIPSVQTLVDIRTMGFLGTIVRANIDHPPRQILIAFIPNTRHVGRPLKSNKESMWESLQRLMNDVPEICIDDQGSLKDWYNDALDDLFFKKLIDHLRDPNVPIPERPNRDANFNPRRSRRTRNQRAESPPRQEQSDTSGNVSPPRNSERTNRSRPRNNRSQERRDQGYDTSNVGKVMYDSLKIFDLGYGATIAEVKAK